jgi:hypothetical protein
MGDAEEEAVAAVIGQEAEAEAEPEVQHVPVGPAAGGGAAAAGAGGLQLAPPVAGQRPDNKKLLLTHSRASISCLISAAYCERINSKANIISTKGNFALSHTEISRLVPLRMNRALLEYLLTKYVIDAEGKAVLITDIE